MSNLHNDLLLQMETTCGTLLYELQVIWDEVGESDAEKGNLLLEIEQECLEIYRRKVDEANRCRARLRQEIADWEIEIAAICSAMGERPVHIRQSDQNARSLKDELRAIIPQLEELRKRKCDRRNQFIEVLEQIKIISYEIYKSLDYSPSKTVVDETDLSLRKLEELHRQLLALQKEKSDRVKQVLAHLNTLNALCLVLGIDFKHTASEVHPSLDDPERTKDINNDTIERLAAAIQRLLEVKKERMQRLQDLATSMLELWNLMDTPLEEQQMFHNVTCNIAASEHEITEPNTLSVDFIRYVEAEVLRLEELKASKMKELVLKKRSELGEICRRTHVVPEVDSEYAIDAIESGAVDPACILEQIEAQIAKVKEEAFNRKEILEKVDKWLAACEEECWLEEYNRDANRYNAGRGAHLTLKRAEKARVVINKLPAIMEALISKTSAWEKERSIEFTYDSVRLLSMLEEYKILRQEKEQECRRLRDQKKLEGQLIAEQEALFGSKPSPLKPQCRKKVPRTSTGGGASSRRLSLGGTMLHNPKPDRIQSAKATTPCPNKERGASFNPNDLLNHHQDDGFAALSAGRRGLDIAGLPLKKHSFDAANAHEIESHMPRKPLSPVSSAVSSKANGALQRTNLSNNNTPLTKPSKLSSGTDEENRTPKAMLIPVPTTPATVSVSMQTATTPAPPSALFGTFEEIEYSFEEIRAGFVLPKLHLNSVVVLV